MRDKNMKEKTVKVMGPWVNGVRTVKEISMDANGMVAHHSTGWQIS